MNVYYIYSRESLNKYNMENVASKGSKTIDELHSDINVIANFNFAVKRPL